MGGNFVMRCNKCMHHFVSYSIPEKKISEYYALIDSEFYNQKAEQIVDKRYRQHIKIRDQILAYCKNGNILDVGCGNGHLLSHFNDNTWIKYGVEPSPIGANNAKKNFNIEVINDIYSSKYFHSDFFDVIILQDILEHIGEA